jgi:hypothetical protein
MPGWQVCRAATGEKEEGRSGYLAASLRIRNLARGRNKNRSRESQEESTNNANQGQNGFPHVFRQRRPVLNDFD